MIANSKLEERRRFKQKPPKLFYGSWNYFPNGNAVNPFLTLKCTTPIPATNKNETTVKEAKSLNTDQGKKNIGDAKEDTSLKTVIVGKNMNEQSGLSDAIPKPLEKLSREIVQSPARKVNPPKKDITKSPSSSSGASSGYNSLESSPIRKLQSPKKPSSKEVAIKSADKDGEKNLFAKIPYPDDPSKELEKVDFLPQVFGNYVTATVHITPKRHIKPQKSNKSPRRTHTKVVGTIQSQIRKVEIKADDHLRTVFETLGLESRWNNVMAKNQINYFRFLKLTKADLEELGMTEAKDVEKVMVYISNTLNNSSCKKNGLGVAQTVGSELSAGEVEARTQDISLHFSRLHEEVKVVSRKLREDPSGLQVGKEVYSISKIIQNLKQLLLLLEINALDCRLLEEAIKNKRWKVKKDAQDEPDLSCKQIWLSIASISVIALILLKSLKN